MLIKRYRGQVLKHMRQVPRGILLTFLSPKGQRGEQRVVSQADWERFGSETFEEGKRLDDFRNTAKETTAA
jgi:hypothetical protein